MPDSPAIITARPLPACICVQRRTSNSSFSSRPTSGLSTASCSASNRLPTAASFSTCQTCTGPGMPFKSKRPRSAQSNRRPIWWRVAVSMTTPSSLARLCRRAARLGVSPIAVCCLASPVPIISPITTRPVATDAQPQPFAGAWCPADLADHRKCRAHSPLGIGLTGFRPAEVDQHAVPDVARDEAAEALDRGGHGGLILANHRVRSSGSKTEESAVKPTTSQNITLTWRRSAEFRGSR